MRSLFLILFLGFYSQANNPGVSYQGRIIRPDGTPLEGANVQFRMQVRSPGSENCLLYEEIQSINMSSSSGVFALTLNDGTGTRLDSPTYQIDRVFANRDSMTLDSSRCSVGTTYAPNSGDGRKFVVYFKDETMTAYEPLPIMSLNFAPQSMYALESQKVGSFAVNNILRAVDGSGNPVVAPALDPTQLTNLTNLLAGTSTQYATSTQFNTVQSFAKSAPPTCGVGEVLKSNGTTLSCVTGGGAASLPSTGATATNTIDSSNFSQTWNWSTATTQSPLSMSANALTTGSVLKVSTSSSSLNSTSGLINVANTSASTSGVLARFQSNSTVGSGLTILADGSVGIGTASPATALDLAGALSYRGIANAQAPSVSPSGQGRIYFDSTTNKFRISANGSNYADLLSNTTGIITITSVSFGASGGTNTCGTYVQSLCNGQNTCTYKGDNINCGGDPASGQSKQITVNWNCGGGNLTNVTNESTNTSLTCPVVATDWSFANNKLYYSTGNVGIGTSNPSKLLHLLFNTSGADNGLMLENSGTAGPVISLKSTSTGGRDYLMVSTAADNSAPAGSFGIYDNSGGGYRMVVSPTGNVGIGENSPTAALQISKSNSMIRLEDAAGNGSGGFSYTVGGSEKSMIKLENGSIKLWAGDSGWITNNAMSINTPGYYAGDYTFNVTSSSTVMKFRGFTGGNDYAMITVGTGSGGNMLLQSASAPNQLFLKGDGNVGVGTVSPATTLQVAGVISPATNNNYSLGNATYRFTEVFATNGVINTSDRREKKDIFNSDLGLNFINKLRPVSYRWNTGVDNDIHYGLIAQEAEQAIAGMGKTEKTSIVTHDESTDRYGVRYSELISPLIKAVQELYGKMVGADREMASVKEEVTLLKSENEKLKQENEAIKARLEKIENALNSK